MGLGMPLTPDDLADRIAKARAAGDRGEAAGSEGSTDVESNEARASGLRIGLEFASAILAGVGLGLAADHWLGTKPFGLLILMLLGFVVGLFSLRRSL